MAGRGPVPKNPATRQRTNRSTTARKVVAAAAPRKAPPKLPKRRAGWHARTIAWWRDLWRSEVAPTLQLDYYPMLRLAELWDDYNGATEARVRVEIAKEIRIIESRWGLDEASRRSLQLEIVRPGDKAEPDEPPSEETVDPRMVLRAVK